VERKKKEREERKQKLIDKEIRRKRVCKERVIFFFS